MRSKTSWLVPILCLLGLLPLLAGPPEILQKSPDGKWSFRAHWYQEKGYLWELKDTVTHKVYPLQSKPAKDEELPRRISALWSPDSRYVAINVFYGRIAYEVNIVAVFSDGPKFGLQWPACTERDMLKPGDQKLWDGTGIPNGCAEKWEADDVLTITWDMNTTLSDNADDSKRTINSNRVQKIRFIGTKGKVVDEGVPVY